jgi:hypothetical protein
MGAALSEALFSLDEPPQPSSAAVIVRIRPGLVMTG